MTSCENCGHDVRGVGRFCTQCGAPTEAPVWDTAWEEPAGQLDGWAPAPVWEDATGEAGPTPPAPEPSTVPTPLDVFAQTPGQEAEDERAGRKRLPLILATVAGAALLVIGALAGFSLIDGDPTSASGTPTPSPTVSLTVEPDPSPSPDPAAETDPAVPSELDSQPDQAAEVLPEPDPAASGATTPDPTTPGVTAEPHIDQPNPAEQPVPGQAEVGPAPDPQAQIDRARQQAATLRDRGINTPDLSGLDDLPNREQLRHEALDPQTRERLEGLRQQSQAR